MIVLMFVRTGMIVVVAMRMVMMLKVMLVASFNFMLMTASKQQVHKWIILNIAWHLQLRIQSNLQLIYLRLQHFPWCSNTSLFILLQFFHPRIAVKFFFKILLLIGLIWLHWLFKAMRRWIHKLFLTDIEDYSCQVVWFILLSQHGIFECHRIFKALILFDD